MIEFPISKAFQFIEPGPVVLVSTAHKGKANVMTLSWHMVVDFTPLIGCIIGPWDWSYNALMATKECVIAVPTVDLLKKVVDIGNCSGRDIDKFARFDLTPLPAKDVQAPLVAECLANIECRVVDTTLTDKYGLSILEGVRAWIDPDRKERRTCHANGDGTFVVDGETIDLKERMVKWQDTL
ncbi:MAG: flavin reductase family protein [Acetomicrobium sp.]|jgi:flavin reductase (DIM6/NTAB) family NADH-FMN oxidoreductase RutF|uniref:flavin reductase family protein n=1 Tax=Acetomicrobium sp. TaxID=1872099 RepID=UPI002B25D797|nr:flavin reductase family protein [Acetomicrobium sp.]HPT64986.1 flavin reductase family protein [Acetomicrobium sp.]